jgi:hypothetical protein
VPPVDDGKIRIVTTVVGWAGIGGCSLFLLFSAPPTGISVWSPMRSLLSAMSSIQVVKPMPAAAW